MVSVNSFELSVQFRLFNCFASRALRELLSLKAVAPKQRAPLKICPHREAERDPVSYFFPFNAVLNLIGVKRGMSYWRTT